MTSLVLSGGISLNIYVKERLLLRRWHRATSGRAALLTCSICGKSSSIPISNCLELPVSACLFLAISCPSSICWALAGSIPAIVSVGYCWGLQISRTFYRSQKTRDRLRQWCDSRCSSVGQFPFGLILLFGCTRNEVLTIWAQFSFNRSTIASISLPLFWGKIKVPSLWFQWIDLQPLLFTFFIFFRYLMVRTSVVWKIKEKASFLWGGSEYLWFIFFKFALFMVLTCLLMKIM